MASSQAARVARVHAAAVAAFAPIALAHTGQGDAHDFLGGFMHPLFALDHATALIAIGALAWTAGRRARWSLPGAFTFLLVAALLAGLIHGNAHGAELRPDASAAHACGFVLASALLQAAGFMLAAVISRLRRQARRLLQTSR